MKCYIGKTFVDPTHCRFRYMKAVYNKEKITYHVWEARYLADQANVIRTNQKNTGVIANNVYNVAIFLFIALADKGYIGDCKVTVHMSAIAKIHTS